MSVDISSSLTGAVLYSSAVATETAQAVIEGIKRGANLSGANLYDANLSDADLSDANLRGAKRLPFTPLQIQGSRDTITVFQYGRIQIGCMNYQIERWEESYRAIGTREGYTEQEIEEYADHIAHCRRYMERYNALKVPEQQAEATE